MSRVGEAGRSGWMEAPRLQGEKEIAGADGSPARGAEALAPLPRPFSITVDKGCASYQAGRK
jgi:hypothetical protein